MHADAGERCWGLDVLSLPPECGLSDMDRLDLTAESAYLDLQGRQTVLTKKRFERKCGLAATGLLWQFWSQHGRVHAEKWLDKLHWPAAYAEGRCTYEKLQQNFQPNAYKRSTDWFYYWLRSRHASESQKRWAIWEVFGQAEMDSQLWSHWYDDELRRIVEAHAQTDGFFELADLYEYLYEQGCANNALLSHCARKQHVKGCWVVDFFLDLIQRKT